MFKLTEAMQETAKELLTSEKVEVVVGFTQGEKTNPSIPYFAMEAKDAKNFVFDQYSQKVLSKYLLQEELQDKKVAIFLKGCDYRALALMIGENRISRENVYLIGLSCPGGETPGFCQNCKQKTPPRDAVDLLLAEEGWEEREHQWETQEVSFPEIQEIENLTENERFDYWKEKLNRCKRCFTCRNGCPVCTCRVCIFDREREGYLDPAKDQLAQHQFFHIIRAFHVGDRCIGCGECARICPEGIPLHLLHQKLKKDLEAFYGAYEAGMDPLPAPLSRAHASERDFFGKEEK